MDFDAEVISSLIGMIYDAALNQTVGRRVLERISDLVGGGPGSLFLAAPQRAAATRRSASARARWSTTRPTSGTDFIRCPRAGPSRRAGARRTILPRAEQERLAFTNEWVRPNGVGGCAHAVLHRAPGLQVELGLSHRRRIDGFAPETSRAVALLPHIRRAVERGVRRPPCRPSGTWRARPSTCWPTPCCWSTPPAGSCARTAPPSACSRGRTGYRWPGRRCGPRRWRRPGRWDASVAPAADPDESRTGGTLSLERPSLRSPLRLLAVPLPAGSAWPESSGSTPGTARS